MEDPQIAELKELVRQNIELTKQTNEMVRSIRRSERLNRFFKAIYWLVILGVLVTFYYFSWPYLMQIYKLYDSLRHNAQESQNFNPAEFFQQYFSKESQ